MTAGVFSSLLPQYLDHSLSPDQRNIIWNSKLGFTIRTPTLFYTGLFFCQAVVDGVTHKSHQYYVHRSGQWCKNSSVCEPPNLNAVGLTECMFSIVSVFLNSVFIFCPSE